MSERWLWTQKEDIGPSPRFSHGMAYEDARQRVVLFGGEEVGRVLGDTWEWDGSAWTQIADMGPSGRSRFGMTYDVSRQRVVLFGGFGGEVSASDPLGDTWEWDGTEWTQMADIGPAPRRNCTMTYNAFRQRVVLFGGYGAGGGVLGDTWEWDGTEWTQIADTGPSGRLLPAMVFDSTRACLVLFGGEDPGVGRLGDTWEWNDDAGWVERQDMGPREIDSPKMASTGEHMVLFGALYAGDDAWGRTWEWEGQLWTQRQDMGPPRRQWYDLAYDSQRDRVVLFGGWDSGSGTSFGDTWELAIMEQLRVARKKGNFRECLVCEVHTTTLL